MRDLSTPSALWDDAERLSLDELRLLQLHRLTATLRQAYTSVVHYRTAFDRLDELTVRVVAQHSSLSDVTKAQLSDHLTSLVKQNVGVTVDVEVTEPHALERSQGKVRRIEDQHR